MLSDLIGSFPPLFLTHASGEVIHASPRAADDAVSDSSPSASSSCGEITIDISYTSIIRRVVAPSLCSVADVKMVLANHFGLPSSANLCLVYAGVR